MKSSVLNFVDSHIFDMPYQNKTLVSTTIRYLPKLYNSSLIAGGTTMSCSNDCPTFIHVKIAFALSHIFKASERVKKVTIDD